MNTLDRIGRALVPGAYGRRERWLAIGITAICFTAGPVIMFVASLFLSLEP